MHPICNYNVSFVNQPFCQHNLVFHLYFHQERMMKGAEKSLRRVGTQLGSKRLQTNYGSMQTFGSKYGPPGRSANSGITATVFGAYGFIGRYFLFELGMIILVHH